MSEIVLLISHVTKLPVCSVQTEAELLKHSISNNKIHWLLQITKYLLALNATKTVAQEHHSKRTAILLSG